MRSAVALRRAPRNHHRLRCNHCIRESSCAGVIPPISSYATTPSLFARHFSASTPQLTSTSSNSFSFGTSTRSVSYYHTLGLPASVGGTQFLSLPSNFLKVQKSNFHKARSEAELKVSRGEVVKPTINPKLLINVAKEQLPKFYASPAALVDMIGRKKIVLLDCKSIVIERDGKQKQWYTATYIDTGVSKEYFHSGKFSTFIDEIGKENPWNDDIPSFSSEETNVVDGKVYYGSENTAKEAAAARALDCLAFRYKYLDLSRMVTSDDALSLLEPLRYCVELPHLYPMFGEDITNSTNMEKYCHAPAYYWSCLMQAKYGPINVEFDVQSMDFDCSSAIGPIAKQLRWYSATCFEPGTGEAYDSGVFGLGISSSGHSYMSDAPKTPLPLEEIRTFGGRVYYKDELTAKHAAAARAIDCLNFQAIVNDDGSKNGSHAEISQLCLDEPNLASDDTKNMQSTSFEELEATVENRRRGSSDFSFMEYIFSQRKEEVISNPAATLQKFLYSKYGRLYKKTNGTGSFGKMYDVTSMKNDDGIWFTAKFGDPVTKEEYPSGLVRVPENPMPFHLSDVCVFDGTVYYKADVAHALNAAAARAIDCYIMQDKEQEDVGNPIQLCYERPYKSIEKGGLSQSIDYEAMLAHRDIYLSEMRRNLLLPTKNRSSFSTIVKSTPQLLHVPKRFLFDALLIKYGQKYENYYKVHRMMRDKSSWYTATFTDPITKETFSSGLGGKVGAEKKAGYILRPPLHTARAKVMNRKVYYRQDRLAEHAAAARAIDCYLFREENETPGILGANSENFKLCLEDPYESEEERDARRVPYHRLRLKRDQYLNEEDVV